MKGKSLLSVDDFSREEIIQIFKMTERLKMEQKAGIIHHLLLGKSLAMIFEKPSTRTRISFEMAMFQLGGTSLYLSPKDLQLGRGESIKDTAKVLGRYVNGIMARTFKHKFLEELASSSGIPVINGLTDWEHPCQAISDIFTIYEKKGDEWDKMKMAYIGDGNNVCHSLLLAAAKIGLNIWVASPKEYRPAEEIVKRAKDLSKINKGEVIITDSPSEAVLNADIIYTDVWVSMGQEEEKEAKEKVFKPFQVNSTLLSKASSEAIVMHCLPAHRGKEITDEVIDGEHSVVFDQAENRLHTQKAILAMLL